MTACHHAPASVPTILHPVWRATWATHKGDTDRFFDTAVDQMRVRIASVRRAEAIRAIEQDIASIESGYPR